MNPFSISYTLKYNERAFAASKYICQTILKRIQLKREKKMGNWNEWTRLARHLWQRRQFSVIICKRYLDKHVKNYNTKGIPCHAMPKKPACFLSPCRFVSIQHVNIDLTWSEKRVSKVRLKYIQSFIVMFDTSLSSYMQCTKSESRSS